MHFDEFVRLLDAAIRSTASVERFEPAGNAAATWATRSRNAHLVLVPPQNVSVTLEAGSRRSDTTWYPVDAALVPVVSKRIAGFLSEA